MKLRDASPSKPHRDDTRYLARIETPLNAAGVKRIQSCVQAYTKDHSRVLVAPTRCLGVLHQRGSVFTLLCEVAPAPTSVSTSQQELKVSKIQVQPDDVIIFSLLPGGSQLMRSFYRAQVKDWADDLIVDEVEWSSWISLATAIR